MPRRKATAVTENPIAAEQSVAESAPPLSGEEIRSSEERQPSEMPVGPRAQKVATLGASNGSPRMRLLRSSQYKQMQIQFDQDPGEKYKEMLKDAGWRDRTEDEGIWTKQLPREGEKWRAVADAERLFQDIANGIRADQGLGSVLSM